MQKIPTEQLRKAVDAEYQKLVQQVKDAVRGAEPAELLCGDDAFGFPESIQDANEGSSLSEEIVQV